MANPNKKKIVLPVAPDNQAHGPVKHLHSKKVKLPYGVPGHGLTEMEREVSIDEPPPLPINEKLNVVGKRTKRADAIYKVTGTAKYTSDIQLPGMLYGKFLRSPHPHARIKSLDVSAARRYPGVHAVHVLKMEPGGSVERDSGHDAPAETYNIEELPLLRYVGQPIAAVAAESQYIADEAARLIKVEYETRPFVLELDKARQKGAPIVFEKVIEDEGNEGDVGVTAAEDQEGNLRGPSTGSFLGGPRGDVEKAFAEADFVLEREFRTQVQTHCCLETHGVVADWQPDMLTVYASTQNTAGVRDDLAELFGLPKSKVRVITEYMGGGFGSKFGAGHYGVMATILSKKAGRPVKLMLSREEEHISAGNRPNSHQMLKMGFKNDGKITAIDLTSYGTAGVGLGAGVGRIAQDMYECPNFRTAQYDVFTHAGPGAAFRAPGNVQGVFSVEQMIDEAAERLGLDPLKYRDVIDKHEVRKLMRLKGAEAFGWEYKKPGSDPGPIKRGFGMAQGQWTRFINLNSSATVRINKDGSVAVMSSVQDIGTGTKTILAQVVAEELGLAAEDITVKIGDTLYPDGPGSGGSVTAGSITPAVRNAAYKAKMDLLGQVAGAWDVEIGDLEMKNGDVYSRSDSSKKMSFGEAVKKMRTNQIMATASRPDDYGGFEIGNGIGYGRLGSVQFAEVLVDTETGFIKVERVVAAHSCGRPLNPMQVESQINGGVIMGVGYALYEDRILDLNTGHQINANLDQYKLPYSKEIPKIETVIIEHYGAFSSTDASGIGEPANIPTAGAIANAVYNAIGVRLYELPMTPQKVLTALGVS
ncbi:MAG: xanthine dehydrogenase family protein molybdopterin-binding subunit [Lewinellaceae bacterium]|nr:xanthine dehydrogenase family protein molybdopterin-binding subunit [Lewinellaceae bacterium]